MSAEYWPREKSNKYHYYIVDPVSEEETPNFTLRQFKVNDMMVSDLVWYWFLGEYLTSSFVLHGVYYILKFFNLLLFLRDT